MTKFLCTNVSNFVNVGKRLLLLLLLSLFLIVTFYHRFRFYATIGGFHETKIVFWLPSIIDTIYGNA